MLITKTSRIIFLTILMCSLGSGFAERYQHLSQLITAMAAGAKTGDSESIDTAITNLSAAEERLEMEKTAERKANTTLSAALSATPYSETKAAERLKKAKGISDANLRKINELIALCTTELQRTNQKRSQTKPAGIDASDFILQQRAD